ncbi:secreted protein [Colletotrichum tofieldiae]|uniref:Secreted protein n=1 Tax=Colletotrichum tofieldiae TaxID=708197 RepID=A0A166VX48_9PEZI|nr:secreted protein [Colletotrichum tofieldiae]
MVQLVSLLALSFAGAAIASPVINIEERQNSGDNVTFAVTGVKYSGEGCPQGTLVGNLDNDGNFEVLYKALDASIKPKQPKVKVKCRIEVDVQTNADTQLVILSGTYRGHVRLTEGAWAKNQNQYKFANNPDSTDMEWTFKGPTDLATSFTNTLSTEFQSGCNSNGGRFTLIINNYLTLTTEGTGEGEISVTELDGAVKQSIKLITKRCS